MSVVTPLRHADRGTDGRKKEWKSEQLLQELLAARRLRPFHRRDSLLENYWVIQHYLVRVTAELLEASNADHK